MNELKSLTHFIVQCEAIGLQFGNDSYDHKTQTLTMSSDKTNFEKLPAGGVCGTVWVTLSETETKVFLSAKMSPFLFRRFQQTMLDYSMPIHVVETPYGDHLSGASVAGNIYVNDYLVETLPNLYRYGYNLAPTRLSTTYAVSIHRIWEWLGLNGNIDLVEQALYNKTPDICCNSFLPHVGYQFRVLLSRYFKKKYADTRPGLPLVYEKLLLDSNIVPLMLSRPQWS